MFGKAHVAEQIDFRQRKLRAVAKPVLAPPPPPPQVIELVLRGLHDTGFRKSDARRAVDHISQRCVATGGELDVQDVLRGAISGADVTFVTAAAEGRATMA